MSDSEYQIECTTRDLAEYVAKDFNCDWEEALRKVYNSETYKKLCNTKTGLFFQSPLYVYDFLKNEIKNGKME